jgi:hypothetical protein
MANTKAHSEFVICLQNDDCEDLVRGKVYQVLPDARAAKSAYLRIIDESGEDYLYPESFFTPVDLPLRAREALSAVR